MLRRCAARDRQRRAAATTASTSTAAAPACGYLSGLLTAPPAGAVLLASYPSERSGALSNAAFTYDNSVAAIALVACGHTPLARRIGDALLLALDHDRYWHDGRLRNGYAAGAIRAAPLKLAGWWDLKSQRWLEDDYQAGSDSGNIAWAMLALLTLHAASGDQRYRDGALRLARWVEGTLDTRGAGGFIGGYFGHEPAPQRLRWKSTEHNTDLAAAFGWLARVTGDAHWQQRAGGGSGFCRRHVECRLRLLRGRHGRGRRDAQSAAGTGCAGVAADGIARRREAAEPVLQTLDRRLRFEAGYSYSEAGGGLWIEGTAQAAVLLELLHRAARARALRAAIEWRAQRRRRLLRQRRGGDAHRIHAGHRPEQAAGVLPPRAPGCGRMGGAGRSGLQPVHRRSSAATVTGRIPLRRAGRVPHGGW